MFTGIVEEKGQVLSLQRNGETAKLTVFAPSIGPKVAVGESVAVNGCCLTATRREGGELTFDLLGETLARTNLGEAKVDSSVNLERALAANGRLGGHFVQGHIDCTSLVVALEKSGSDRRLEIELPPSFSQYVIPQGSIAINGVSLTVAELKPTSLVVWLIPHTFSSTNLRELSKGAAVNLEFDLLAKQVERLLQTRGN